MNYKNHNSTVVNSDGLRQLTKPVNDFVMAAYGVSFESSSNIEEAKERKRQARQEVLQKVRIFQIVGLFMDGFSRHHLFWVFSFPR